MSTPGSASLPLPITSAPAIHTTRPRHSALVRVTHWITALCFFALLVTGAEIVISHPRFYWGETGNINTEPLFRIHIPASRALVPTGYSYTMPDQNGWSRALHFQTAWLLVLTGVLYVGVGLTRGHFRKNLVPDGSDLKPKNFFAFVAHHLRFQRPSESEAHSYNVLQRLAYLSVIFILFPLVVWTGLALSPAFDSAFPATVNLLGGRQTARTLHFFVTIALVLFVLVHVVMVWRAGFIARLLSMITGRVKSNSEQV